jgi:hypothetical protein
MWIDRKAEQLIASPDVASAATAGTTTSSFELMTACEGIVSQASIRSLFRTQNHIAALDAPYFEANAGTPTK